MQLQIGMRVLDLQAWFDDDSNFCADEDDDIIMISVVMRMRRRMRIMMINVPCDAYLYDCHDRSSQEGQERMRMRRQGERGLGWRMMMMMMMMMMLGTVDYAATICINLLYEYNVSEIWGYEHAARYIKNYQDIRTGRYVYNVYVYV